MGDEGAQGELILPIHSSFMHACTGGGHHIIRLCARMLHQLCMEGASVHAPTTR